MSTSVKISELPVLASADAADEFVVVDDSAGVTKKITQAGLANFGTNALTAGTVSASGLVTASGGITFGADTLDDYEEGTWTPSFVFSTSGSVSGVFNGYYTKIGRFVHATCRLVTTSYSSPSGNTSVAGLPYATKINSTYRAHASIGFAISLNSDLPNLRAYTLNNSSEVRLVKNATNASETSLLGSDFPASGNSFLGFNVVYETDA